MLKCKNCGMELNDDIIFCTRCGQVIISTEEKSNTQRDELAEETDKAKSEPKNEETKVEPEEETNKEPKEGSNEDSKVEILEDTLVYKNEMIKKANSELEYEKSKAKDLEYRLDLKDIEIKELHTKNNYHKAIHIFLATVLFIFFCMYMSLNSNYKTTENLLDSKENEVEQKLKEITDEGEKKIAQKLKEITEESEKKVAQKLQEVSVALDTPLIATNISISSIFNGTNGNKNQQFYNYDEINYMEVTFDILKLNTNYSYTDNMVYVRFIDPNGKLLQYGGGSSVQSPEGYTQSVDITSASLSANIGSQNVGVFIRGNHNVEIYFEGKLIGRKAFTVV